MKIFQFTILGILAGLLMFTVADLPARGDLNAPAQQITNAAGTPVAGAYYIQNAYKDTKTPNMVCVVLADYRSTDTLGELIVVFAGAMSAFFVLRRRP